MKNLITLLLFSCFFISATSGQNQLSGTVVDGDHNGVFFSTVALYNQKDSSLVKAESTDDDGKFKLKGIKDGVYYMEATMIGYETGLQENIVFPKDNKAKFELTMTESAIDLATAEVVGRKPLLEQEADRLIVNVADNVTSLNGNVLDVMKKVPGMLVVGDKLSMAGQQNMTIYINGKSTQYMDVNALLRDMPGDNIQKVEVIHQPGAEFDAAGTGPVINIILKKNALFGTNGSVTLGTGKGQLWKHKLNAQLSHYQGDVNINASAGYRINPYQEDMLIRRDVEGDIYDQVSLNPAESNTFRANLGLNWDIDKRQRIGFESRMIDSRADYFIETTTDIDFLDDAKTDLDLLTRNRQEETWKMYVVNPFYSIELDTSGQKLDVDVSYVNFSNDGGSTLNTTETNYDAYFGGERYQQPGSSNIYVGKLDYVYPFNKMLKLKAGGKYSVAKLDNNLIASMTASDASGAPKTESEWIDNPLQSNHFLFDETIAAAYAKMDWKTGKWSGTAGVRYEHSESEGMSVNIDSTLNRTISKPFPSASLKYEINKSLAATAAYSYRLDRPRYSTLNPFVYYLDPFTSQRGNPNLKPTFTHSFRTNLTYDNQPFFNIEYKISEDPMVEVVEQEASTGEAFKTDINLQRRDNFSASLFFPLDFIPHISGYGGGIVNHVNFDSRYKGEVFDPSQWSFTGFMQVNSKLPGKVQVEASGWYYSGGIEGIIVGEHLYGVDVGASKKFLNDKLKVSVGVDNLLVRFWHGNVDFGGMNARIISKWDAPVFNLQLNYKFGNQHMKSKKHRGGASDELNRVGKG